MSDLTFFSDAAVDRVVGVVLELAGEVYVLRDRLHRIERLLEEKGCLDRADLETMTLEAADREAQLADRDAFIARVLAPMTYEADSPNPAYEPA